jgi:hypothetical protein
MTAAPRTAVRIDISIGSLLLYLGVAGSLRECSRAGYGTKVGDGLT